jgi:cationic peptide transport system substrate-binding protein
MKLFSLIYCLGIALLLTGCKPVESAKTSGAVYCVDSFSQHLNPQILGSSPFVSSLSQQVYNRLIEVNPETQRLDGALAENWSINRSGLVYTFNLRRNVFFHHNAWFTPHREFNADDVVFSFQRIIDPNHPFHAISGTRYPFFDNRQFADVLQDVKKVTDYQVQFILRHPDSSFMATLASDYAVILSAEYGDQLQHNHSDLQDLDDLPIGTGPFQFLELRPDEYLRLGKNTTYWGSAPKLEQLVFDYTPRASKRLSKLFTGECQVIATPAASQMPFIRNNPRTDVDIQNDMNTTYLALNTSKKPLNDVRVRKAIAMAINRDNLQKAVFYETGETAISLLPPASWAHYPNLNEYYFDPEKAKSLLADAGYPNGFDLTMWVQPIAKTYNPNASKTAQLISGDLARIGINIQLIETRWSIMRQNLQEGRHDLALLSWAADNADPDNFLRPLLSCEAIGSAGNNYSGWCNPDFDAHLDKALATQRLSQRIFEYQQNQEMIYQNVPVIPLAHALMVSAYLRNIHDVVIPPTGGASFKKAYRE